MQSTTPKVDVLLEYIVTSVLYLSAILPCFTSVIHIGLPGKEAPLRLIPKVDEGGFKTFTSKGSVAFLNFSSAIPGGSHDTLDLCNTTHQYSLQEHKVSITL